MNSQINIKKSTSFSAPPSDKLGYGFDEFGNPCMINADGTKTILGTEAGSLPSILANKGIGLDANLPETFVQDDIYVTTDTLKVYTAIDSINWSSVDLESSQFVTNKSGSSPVLYQYDGTDLQVLVNTNDKGWFADEAALTTAYPTGENGWYANVGETDTMWIWDGDSTAWVDSGVVGNDMSSEIQLASTKAIALDADEFGYVDIAGGNILKKFTWANIKSTLKTYFDGIYSTFSGAYNDLTGKPDLTVYAVKTELLNSQSVASSATPTPVGSSRENEYYLTALAVNALFGVPSGTIVNGNTLFIRIEDNGTVRTLTWNVIYRAMSETLPSTTVVGKILYVGFVYNSTDNKWDCIGINQEA